MPPLKLTDPTKGVAATLPGSAHRAAGLASPQLTPYVRTRQQSKVYEAEKRFRHLVRKRQQYPRVAVGGLTLDVPDMITFGDLSTVQAYVNQITTHVGASRISVRTSERMAKHATYRGGVITLPLGGDDHRWAWRAAVVLHEVAHHLAGDQVPHSSPFPGTLVDLFTEWISPEAGLLLRVLYTENDVRL